MSHCFKIVLVEPDIPQNTGNIARLCACTGSELYLVGKLGFLLTDRHLKRAGLDYWNEVKIERINSLSELEQSFKENNFYYFSTRAKNSYTKVNYKTGDFMVFGSETRGLPEELIRNNPEKCFKIPMKTGSRSLNLSNSVSIVLYEGIRQSGTILL